MTGSWAIPILVIVAALLLKYYYGGGDVVEISRNWEQLISLPRKPPSRIAIGLNVNLDLIVSGTSLLKALGQEPSNVTSNHPVLDTIDHVQQCLAYSMDHCAGLERFFSNRSLYQLITDKAAEIDHEYFIGGNAALMAEKIVESTADRSTTVLLAGPIGTKLKELLNPAMNILKEGSSLEDEIHLILEYAQGEQWGTVTAKCANRIIFSHDVSNSELTTLEEFEKQLSQFKPDLVILSGSHLLDRYERQFYEQRINRIAATLRTVSEHVPVHLELASTANAKFCNLLAHVLLPLVDSVGLNEQELQFIAHSANAYQPRDSISSFSAPEIGYLADLMYWMLTSYGGRLSRVHMHSLTYHMIAVASDKWENSISSVAAGARVAGLQACNVTQFSDKDFSLLIPKIISFSVEDEYLRRSPVVFSGTEPVMTWKRKQISFYFTPVLVCNQPIKTVGLGDAISSTALIHTQLQSAIYSENFS